MKKKISINESKQKLFEMMGNLGQEYVQEDAETPEGVIGKTVGQAFPQLSDITGGIEDKVIQYAKYFPSTGTFTASGDAKKFLKSEGYSQGSMYMNYPMAFIKDGKFGVEDDGTTLMPTVTGEERPMIITKWERLGRAQMDMIDGVVVSEDFREGDAYVLFFTFPE